MLMDVNYAVNHEKVSVPCIYSEVLFDESGKPVDCMMLDVNPAYEALVDMSRDKIVGKTITEIFGFESRNVSEIIRINAEVALKGESQEYEYFSTQVNKWMYMLVVNQGSFRVSVFLNISRKDNLLENELKKSNYINSLLLDSIPHPALLVRKDRTVIAANRIAQDQGSRVGGFCWRDWGKSIHLKDEDIQRADSYVPGESNIIRCSFCQACESLEINDVKNIKTKIGDVYWDIFWAPTQEEGVYLHYAIDITEEKKKEKEIKYLSYHDSLTGLYNRTYFEKKLEKMNASDETPISIIIGDINGLKMTNDVFGHYEGDKLLKCAARILQESCRVTDTVARYGGDEFAIILPKTPYQTVVEICKNIYDLCQINNQEAIPTSISLGCATKESSEENIYKILKSAENMMYKHKFLESKSIRNSILSSLEISLHEKDIETKEHGHRLIQYTEKMGKALNLKQGDMDDLNLFARLHDIGKIAVDERILNKQEPLMEEEFAAIKKHSEAGYRIAQSSQDMHHIAEYILTHHERWDGKGYPQGLKKEEIPLLSRILAIADAYDAMTNDRPYRKAMNIDDATTELINCSGKHFDPNLIPIFLSVLDDR